MADLTKVVLDAMGGDHAPGEMVKLSLIHI